MRKVLALFRAPRRDKLSAWAAENARLPDGSRYEPWPFQIGILDEFTNPHTRRITFQKSSRIGYTQILLAAVAYFQVVSPCKVVYARPTWDEVEKAVKTDFDPIGDWPVMRPVKEFVAAAGKKAHTLRLRIFPGGSIRFTAANTENSWTGYDADKLLLDEISRYLGDVGGEGSPIFLAEVRQVQSFEPLTVSGSSPVEETVCHVTHLFRESDRRTYRMPCPHCQHEQAFEFGSHEDDAPGLKWEPENDPKRVWYQCAGPLKCEIAEGEKLAMMKAGRWVAEFPEVYERTGHAGFYCNALYSLQPNATWRDIAVEFLAKRKNPNHLKTFLNTTLGLPWVFKGEAPDWQRLYDRREDWEAGTVPMGVCLLTTAVDVQKDRIEIFTWGWAPGVESWLIDHKVCMGSPWDLGCWDEGFAYLQGKTYPHACGLPMKIAKIAVDVNYATDRAFAFVRRFGKGQAVAVRGSKSREAPAIDQGRVAEATDDNSKSAKRRKLRGTRLYHIGGHGLTQDLYGFLGIERPTDAEVASQGYPQGYVHLATWVSDELCKQLVAETYDPNKGTFSANRPNEAHDGWKYSRAIAILLGIDRFTKERWASLQSTWGRPLDEPKRRAAPRAKAQAATLPQPERHPEPDAPQPIRPADDYRRPEPPAQTSWLGRLRG